MTRRLLRSISVCVLAAGLVAVVGAPADAKGGPTDATRLFVRTNDRGVTMRVYKSTSPDYGGQPQPCSGPGCPPSACVPRGVLVIGFSNEAAVGQGWAQLYAGTKQHLQLIGTGGFGFEFDAPAGYIAAQTGPDVARVRVRFRGGGSDEMRPNHHLVVLAASIRNPHVRPYNFQGPSGTIEAFDADGTRVAKERFAPTTPTGGQPKACFGGLPTDFPQAKGDPPADEAAARYAATQAVVAAYKPGLSIDQRAALVEDGGSLLTVMKLAAERNPTYRDQITADVHEVRFIDATHAAVKFSLIVQGSTVITGVGRAVLVDGRWLLARDTYCGLQQLGGVWCPKRGTGA